MEVIIIFTSKHTHTHTRTHARTHARTHTTHTTGTRARKHMTANKKAGTTAQERQQNTQAARMHTRTNTYISTPTPHFNFFITDNYDELQRVSVCYQNRSKDNRPMLTFDISDSENERQLEVGGVVAMVTCQRQQAYAHLPYISPSL